VEHKVSNIIEIAGLTYHYQFEGEEKFKALDDLYLQIPEGEYLALIGPNGSGKSTLARHLNALLLPSEGRVMVEGLSTSEEDNRYEIRKLVGMVFQNPDNQIVATTVEEDVAFGLENLAIPPEIIRRRVADALEMVGLANLAHHAPHLLSGGQKQRLAIAGVFAMQPRCLVLDEPTAMLDPRGRREVLETLKRLNHNEKITVVHITHFMEETLEADRIVIMDKGRVVHEGQPSDIFSGAIELEDLGLEIPSIPRVVQILRQGGLNVPPGILDVNQLVSYLC
jgi:energy-coupling factor transport system ATP-binding protein